MTDSWRKHCHISTIQGGDQERAVIYWPNYPERSGDYAMLYSDSGHPKWIRQGDDTTYMMPYWDSQRDAEVALDRADDPALSAV